MKLIQIFALATVMATAAVAQTTGQGNATGSQQSSPSPTPKPTAKAAPAGAKSGAVKTSPAAAAGHAKTSPSRSAHASTKSVAKDKKPAVQTGVLPDKKKKGPAHEPAKAGTKAATPATPAKATAAIKPGAPAKGSAATKGTAKKNMAPAAAGAAKPKGPANAAKAAGPKPKDKMKGAAPAPAAKVTASAPPAPPEKKPLPRLIGAAGRRDPFVSPIRNAGAISPSQSCTSGKRCLNIPELVLQGTVRDISGKMMAVVSTANHTRTYTLRENDQVFNGSVEKITSDSIIFREYVKDLLGRETAKEVVKKLGPTS